MARKTCDELKKIMSMNNVDRIWSWSKINTFHNSKFEYFLKYILKVKPDREDCIYTTTGGMVHDMLEKLYSNAIGYEDMPDFLDDCWMTAFDISQLKFDRNDAEKNEKIAKKYYEDLAHFAKHHKVIERNLRLEQFVDVMVGNNLIHGYIDACYKDDEGNYHIIDWKTSTIYKGSKAENECGQLVLYAMALHSKGIPYEKIKICWNFVKYITVEYTQKNGKVKTRDIERYEIGEKLQSNVKLWLKEEGYDPSEIDAYLDLLSTTNSIECLPDEIQARYKVTDCYVYVDLTDKLIKRWYNYVIDTINDIELREKDYADTKNDKAFWDSFEEVKAQSYYYATLCSYSSKLLKPYQEYLNTLEEAQKEKDNLYANVGSDIGSDEDNKHKIISTTNDATAEGKSGTDDFAWLNDI